MLTEQTLDYLRPMLAPDEAEPAVVGEESILRAHQQVLKPRLSLDTLLAVFASIFALGLIRPDSVPLDPGALLLLEVSVRDIVLAVVFFALWPKILYLTGVYEARVNSARSEIFSVVLACSIGSVLGVIFLGLTTTDGDIVRPFLILWTMLVMVLLTYRGFAEAVNLHLRSNIQRRVLIVGTGMRARRLAREIAGYPRRYELIGYIDEEASPGDEELEGALLGKLDDLEGILAREVVDEVLIALPIKSCYSSIERAIEVSERVGVESKYLADVFRCQLAKVRYEQRRHIPFMSVKVFYDDYRVQVKRLIDIAGSLAGLILLSPVLLGIAIVVKATSPGPIVFAQERYGLSKRRFKMYKFRTMVPDAERLQAQLEDQNEAIGPVFKIRDDPRVTPIGRFLRKTSLDELPQLFNVLKGDMSLVGPRPLPVRDVQLFDEAWFMRRFSVRPGLTCLWQISGRSNLGFDDWVALDLKYIDEWSLSSDFEILARTIPAVLRGVGAA